MKAVIALVCTAKQLLLYGKEQMKCWCFPAFALLNLKCRAELLSSDLFGTAYWCVGPWAWALFLLRFLFSSRPLLLPKLWSLFVGCELSTEPKGGSSPADCSGVCPVCLWWDWFTSSPPFSSTGLSHQRQLMSPLLIAVMPQHEAVHVYQMSNRYLLAADLA